MESYDFETKQRYRQRKLLSFDRLCSRPVGIRRVAYLDTAEALDTINFLKRGYKPENLWAINRSSAQVACLSRRLDALGLPRVNTIGLDFFEALERKVGDVDIIDFDGTGCLTDHLVEKIGCSVAIRRVSVYSLTLLGGRETHHNQTTILKDVMKEEFQDIAITSFGTTTPASHRARVKTMMMAFVDVGKTNRPCLFHATKILWDVYLSTSNQPMIWMATKLEPHRKLSRLDLQKMANKSNGLTYPPRCAQDLSTLHEMIENLSVTDLERLKTSLEKSDALKQS